jgi:3-carboxy-cis,cis-muconate cycloisomerase
MAKIAGDITLLAQTEVGEVAEAAAPGKGGSSAMPQKRNPVDAVGALAAARLALGVVPVVLAAMAQEHERAVGGWQAEWAAIPELFRYTAGAVARVRGAVGGLTVDAGRMRANLERDGGLLMSESLAMALAAHVGRPQAQRIVQTVGRQALAEGLTLAQAAHADARVGATLSPEDIDRALDPAGYLGSADIFIDRALDSYRALQD